MSMLTRCYITALVMWGALVPSRSGGAARLPDTGAVPPGYLPVPPQDASRCLADLGRAAGADGRLALFFPGCLAPAAPAILFRLKREGFSGCRVTATADGLLVDATR
jgi:hypothetical protein